MTIKLYIDYLSQPSRAVLATCLIGKVPFQIVQTRLMRGQTRAQSFLKINPNGRVPAIIDTQNNMCLSESHSIMRYLCLKYPKHLTKWYPVDDLVKRAKIDEYMDFHHTSTRNCANLIFNTLFAKNMGIQDPTFNPEKAQKMVTRALKLFTRIYLNGKKFIGDNEANIADLSAFYQIQFLMLVGEKFEKWGEIKAWIDRMSEIEEVSKANESFTKVLKKRQEKAKL